MHLIWLIYLRTVKVFEKNSILILDKNYDIKIKIDKNEDKTPYEYDEEILEKILINKIWNDRFIEIRNYIYSDNNSLINWIVWDNWSWKSTILESIYNLSIWRPIKRICKNNEGIEFLIQKDEGIIYIFQTENDNHIKTGNKLNIWVNQINLNNYNNLDLDNLIRNNLWLLKLIFKNVLNINNFSLWIKIKSHNNSSNSKEDTIEYLFLFIKYYLWEIPNERQFQIKINELDIVFKMLTNINNQKEFCFLNIIFYFSWFCKCHSRTFVSSYEKEFKYILENMPKILEDNRENIVDTESEKDIKYIRDYFHEILTNYINPIDIDNISEVFSWIKEDIYSFRFKPYLDFLWKKYFDNNFEWWSEYFYYKIIEINENKINSYLNIIGNSNILSFDIIFTNNENQYYYFNNLSSWQKVIITLLSEINNLIDNSKLTNILLIDEPENSLHLRLQIRFLNILLENINLLKKDYKLQFQFIISTHSPFIISDIPKENLIFLERWQFFSEDKSTHNNFWLKETFLTNIADIVSNWFFLDWNNWIITWDIWTKYLKKIKSDITNNNQKINIKDKFDLIEDKFLKEMLFFLNLSEND